MKTQRQWAIRQLLENGYVTRNQALNNFISRLGSIICSLKKEGWSIEGKNIKTAYGKDYEYRLLPVKQPLELKVYRVNGEIVARKIERV